MSRPLFRMIVLTGSLLGWTASAGRAQETPSQMALVQVEFITTSLAGPDPVQQVWKYLETATVERPSVEVLALNGLRVGKLDTGFRKEFDAVLKQTDVVRRVPQLIQMIPGRPQEFVLGRPLADRTVFIWKDADSVIGRRFSRAQYGLAVMAQPDDNQRAQVSVTPVLRYGEGLAEYFDLGFLAMSASMQSGQSIVLMPTGTPTGMGAILYQGVERVGRQRTFIVITLNAVGKVAGP